MKWHTRNATYSLGKGGKVAIIIAAAMICYVPIYFAARQMGAPTIGDVVDWLLNWLR